MEKMSIKKRILTLPFQLLIYIFEKITKPMWDFAGTCFVFYVGFVAANSGVDPENISNALRAVFWNAVLALVAFQTLPQLFFAMFDNQE
jgi:hypothetical protein